MRFADPLFLLLLLLLPFLVWAYLEGRRRRTASLRFSDTSRFKRIRPSRSLKLRHGLFGLRVFLLALLIAGLARPQSALELFETTSEGINTLLCLDVSGSMMAEDLGDKHENRLDVAKEVVKDFIEGRKVDAIGLVVFAAEAYTQCPLTIDYGVLNALLDRVTIRMDDMIEDGTAIGSAQGTAVNRLRSAKGDSKVIILLTDGMNNRGEIDPFTAAELAKALGVRVYTIGVGSKGMAPMPVRDPLFKAVRYRMVPVEIDEDALQKIADTTGGEYFRATDEKGLERIFKQIDRLEKVEIEQVGYRRYKELFGYLVFPALLLLMVEIVLANTRLRKLP